MGYVLAWDVYSGDHEIVHTRESYRLFIEALAVKVSFPAWVDFGNVDFDTIIGSLADITDYLEFDPQELITASVSLAIAQSIMSAAKGLCSACNALLAFLSSNKVSMPTKPTASEVGANQDLQSCTAVQRDNADIVLPAVTRDGTQLAFASERLKDDKDVVLAAVNQSGAVLKYASKRLKDEADVVMAAVSAWGSALEFASRRLQDDTAVVLAAIQSNIGKMASELELANIAKLALKYASRRLKDDKDVVLLAVQQSGLALQYASQRLKDDEDVVLAAVEDMGSALEYASRRLKDDGNFAKRASGRQSMHG